MRPLQIIPANTRIDFVGKRKLAFLFSFLLVLGSLVAVAVQGLNFGIDFRGGTLIEIKTTGPADIAALRNSIGALGLGEVQVQEFGEPDDVLIRIQRQEGSEAEQIQATERVKQTLGGTVRQHEALAGVEGEDGDIDLFHDPAQKGSGFEGLGAQRPENVGHLVHLVGEEPECVVRISHAGAHGKVPFALCGEGVREGLEGPGQALLQRRET